MIDIENLPKGWTIAKLGELVITEKGKKPKRVSKEKTKEYSIPYVNIKAFEKNIIDEYTDGIGCVLCEDDDFLMVWDGSRSGYVGKAIKGALGSTLVRIKLPLVNQDLTYYFLKSKFIEINSRAKGVGIPHVDPNLLWNYDFPLAPLNEQKRILAKLEQLLTDLDKGIEYLETTKQQLKVYRQAVLKKAFEGKLTKGNIDKWKELTLNDVCSLITDGKHGDCQDEKDSGYYFLSAKDVRNNTLLYNNARQITKKDFDETHRRTDLKPGDVCLVNTGATIGRMSIAPNDEKTYRTTFQKSVAVIKCIPELIDTKFFCYLLKSDLTKLVKVSGGSAIPNLLLGTLKKYEIKIPDNLNEQNLIVKEIESRLSVCDKIEENIENSLQQSEALRLSIIKKAFEGKLVPQDPNDEPAEKLLDRIRALRQAQGKHVNGKPQKKEKVKAEKKSKQKRKEKIEI